ncbi:MAG: hypothetical protein HYW93_02855 [Thaumarchaeota archaeon]|nr:hypothetical protein [Nitrososphaerota archaeon]
MLPYSIRFGFTQRFSVPAEDAYRWCTDYHPDDWALMGKRGKRKIKKISDDTIILEDVTYRDGRPVVKGKVVRLDPVRLSWTNTHLTGPTKYSQFLYRITPEGNSGSKLEFTGLQVEYSRTKVAADRIASLERKYREEDSESWRNLARAMEKELGR